MEDTTKRDEELDRILCTVVKRYAAKRARTDDRAELVRLADEAKRDVNRRRAAEDFVRYFTDDICWPGVVPPDAYQHLAAAVLSRPLDVRSSFLLALAAV